MGKESARVGQGKAMKERWIVKDKDTLKANVCNTSTLYYASLVIFRRQTLLPTQVENNYRPSNRHARIQIRKS